MHGMNEISFLCIEDLARTKRINVESLEELTEFCNLICDVETQQVAQLDSCGIKEFRDLFIIIFVVDLLKHFSVYFDQRFTPLMANHLVRVLAHFIHPIQEHVYWLRF